MARGTRTVYPGERNKGVSSTFLLPEEDQSVQRPKRCDKHGDKDEDNSPKNVNNVRIKQFMCFKQYLLIKCQASKIRRQVHILRLQ